MLHLFLVAALAAEPQQTLDTLQLSSGSALQVPLVRRAMALALDGPDEGAHSRSETDRVLMEQLRAKTEAVQSQTVALQALAGDHPHEAGVLMGLLYEDFALDLIGSNVPFYLTEEQREYYVMALEDKAWPWEEKARSAYALVLQRAPEGHPMRQVAAERLLDLSTESAEEIAPAKPRRWWRRRSHAGEARSR